MEGLLLLFLLLLLLMMMAVLHCWRALLQLQAGCPSVLPGCQQQQQQHCWVLRLLEVLQAYC